MGINPSAGSTAGRSVGRTSVSRIRRSVHWYVAESSGPVLIKLKLRSRADAADSLPEDSPGLFGFTADRLLESYDGHNPVEDRRWL